MPTEEEIDALVIAQAEDDSAWEEWIDVKPIAPTSFSLPGELAARAALLARLHHVSKLDDWLAQIIQERIELEEVALAQARRTLLAGS